MNESRPRDLTPEEQLMVQGPAVRGTESAPMRIPPGSQIPIEMWNPGTEVPATAAPSAEPHESAPPEKGGSQRAAPARTKPSR
jgi:hypothetical protein